MGNEPQAGHERRQGKSLLRGGNSAVGRQASLHACNATQPRARAASQRAPTCIDHLCVALKALHRVVLDNKPPARAGVGSANHLAAGHALRAGYTEVGSSSLRPGWSSPREPTCGPRSWSVCNLCRFACVVGGSRRGTAVVCSCQACRPSHALGPHRRGGLPGDRQRGGHILDDLAVTASRIHQGGVALVANHNEPDFERSDVAAAAPLLHCGCVCSRRGWKRHKNSWQASTVRSPALN